MGVTLFLARRLSLSSGGRKSSPAIRVAVVAVALSVLVMMCAIAIVTGFKGEISDKVAGFNSHIIISPENIQGFYNDKPGVLTLTPSLKKILDEQSYIANYAIQASIPAILKTSNDFKGVYLKSLSGSNLTGFINGAIEEGVLPDYSVDSCKNQIVISRKAAEQLHLKTGDRIDTYFMTDAVRVRPLKVAAIFNSHFDNYDDNFAYSALSLIQELGNLSENQGTSIAISVTDFDNTATDGANLQTELIKAYNEEYIYTPYLVTTALQSGASYFQWLRLLDMNVIVVLTLMTIVACVTLVSGMLILMVDKIRFIALMSALGASRKQISKIFMLMATKIAVYGVLIGDILALIILFTQYYTHFLPLDPETYYIDFVPVRISFTALILLNLLVISIIWIVLILPSRFAGRAAPARTLANE